MRRIAMRTGLDLRPFLFATLFALGAMSSAVRAQSPNGTTSECVAVAGPERASLDTARRLGTPTAKPDSTHAAVRVFAAVQASEVAFAREPRICVRLTGDARLDSVRVVGRKNLASPVVAGTTYRDVYVAVEILGHLNAECIAARITGISGGSASNERCASLGVRDSVSSVRPAGGPP